MDDETPPPGAKYRLNSLVLDEVSPTDLPAIRQSCLVAKRATSTEVGPDHPGGDMTVMTKSKVWSQIEAQAQTTVQKSGQVVTKTRSVAAFLSTAEGARRYQQYNAAPVDPPAPKPAAPMAPGCAEIEVFDRSMQRPGETIAQVVRRALETEQAAYLYEMYLHGNE